jgi:hypothetical protein
MNKIIVFATLFSILLWGAASTRVNAVDTSAELLAAINAGDSATVSNLLSSGADPNIRIQGGVPVLTVAAFQGNVEIVKLLLEKGASVNARSDEGVTPLMNAAAKGHKDVAQLLLDKGADANVHDGLGLAAFHLAALLGHKEVADMLRPRTEGAAQLIAMTVVGPLEGKQKCLPVTKLPDEASQNVACLKEGREVTTGASKDNKWANLQKPVSGWVPADKLRTMLVTQAQPAASQAPERSAAPRSRGESGMNSEDMPSTPGGGGGGAWWQRD